MPAESALRHGAGLELIETMRWEPGVETLHIVAKAGEREFVAEVTVPTKLKHVKLSGIVILVDPSAFSRKDA